MRQITKPIICFLLVIMLMLGIVPPTAAEPSSWACLEVEKAIAVGIVPERLRSNYQTVITREEYAEMMVLVYQKIRQKDAAMPRSNPFTDTANPVILKAYALGVVSGVTPTSFAPHQAITRQEICVMLHRVALATIPAEKNRYSQYLGQIPSNVGVDFEDEAHFSSWAYNGIIYANKNGFVYGVSSNLMEPLGYTTREQAMLMTLRLYVFLEKVVELVTEKYINAAGAVEIHSLEEWKQFLNPDNHFLTQATIVLRDDNFGGDAAFAQYQAHLTQAEAKDLLPLAIIMAKPWWYLTPQGYNDYGVFVTFTSPVSFYYNDSGYVLAAYKDKLFYDQLTTDQKELYSIATTVVSHIMKSTDSEWERIKQAHDYLVQNCEYDYSFQKISYTEYGPLIHKSAVCQGYATAMQLLLAMMGLECQVVIGESDNGEGDGYIPHSWNLVKLEGNYYHIDVTWDDPSGGEQPVLRYDYFLKSDSVIAADHKWDRSDYPSCKMSYQ